MSDMVRFFFALLGCVYLSGCGYYLTARPPVMERKLGSPFNESAGALATAADYRVVYVKIKPDATLCAEAPPDAASQFASSFAASLAANPANKPISADAQVNLAVAMRQLFKRSQGVQFYRDGAFFLCNMYLNGALTQQQYLSELKSLRESSVEMIKTEIPYLEKISVDTISAPIVPVITGKTDSGSEGKDQVGKR